MFFSSLGQYAGEFDIVENVTATYAEFWSPYLKFRFLLVMLSCPTPKMVLESKLGQDLELEAA